VKICEICEEVEACVEVKRYENGALRELSLCAHCAQKHGLALPENLADLLLESTLDEVSGLSKNDSKTVSDKGRRCPVCGMHLRDFRKTGRLGCPACYAAWEDVLDPMLLGMHRSLVYKGQVPVSGSQDTKRLEHALADAVSREDYEEAARLRDRIRGMQEEQDCRQEEFSFDENR